MPMAELWSGEAETQWRCDRVQSLFLLLSPLMIAMPDPLSLNDRTTFEDWWPLIGQASDRGDLRLHVGCGRQLLDGWINIDGYHRPGVLKLNLPDGLAGFSDNSARYIYTSHFVEHISYPDEASDFMRECHRVLAPGGVLRVVVPGIEKIIRAYVEDDQAFFDIQASMHPEWCSTPLEHLMYALQQDGEHKYGYDFRTMHKLMSRAGFADIVDSDCNASATQALRIDYRTLRDNHGRSLSLYVDAIK